MVHRKYPVEASIWDTLQHSPEAELRSDAENTAEDL